MPNTKSPIATNNLLRRSVAASVEQPCVTTYSAAKAFNTTFSRALAKEGRRHHGGALCVTYVIFRQTQPPEKYPVLIPILIYPSHTPMRHFHTPTPSHDTPWPRNNAERSPRHTHTHTHTHTCVACTGVSAPLSLNLP
jgi:hypothetical protein